MYITDILKMRMKIFNAKKNVDKYLINLHHFELKGIELQRLSIIQKKGVGETNILQQTL